MRNCVIFTDLDGTLLHPKTYSFEDALPALRLIRQRGVPLVVVSSKTRAEIEVWRKRLGNEHPFVSENGGGVFVPAGYPLLRPRGVPMGDYVVTVLGERYETIRTGFRRVRRELGTAVQGFGDMTAGEVARLTGLPDVEAALARERDFDEPFVFGQGPDAAFLEAIEGLGFRWTRGRFYHIMGASDKGRAVRLLKTWYEEKRGRIVTVGLGDALNDLPLLREVDHPVLVRREDGTHDDGVSLPGLTRTAGIGPAGWNDAVLALLEKTSDAG